MGFILTDVLKLRIKENIEKISSAAADAVFKVEEIIEHASLHQTLAAVQFVRGLMKSEVSFIQRFSLWTTFERKTMKKIFAIVIPLLALTCTHCVFTICVYFPYQFPTSAYKRLSWPLIPLATFFKFDDPSAFIFF